MSKTQISDYDIFYISYDEPKKEENWAKLVDLAPWAKRVDGVKGFDAAHKQCALRSETDRFITVDGDNLVYPEFFDIELDIPDNLKDCTLSWSSRNIINGLCYGNGGLKLWTKDFVLNMRTHENSNSKEEALDFCWDKKYIQLNNVYSDTCPNGSPFQAFRAGFREGVKMSLDRGKLVNGQMRKQLHPKNFKRLLIWATVGSDIENGLWAIYGTRLGIFKSNIDKEFDMSKISDYDWFKEYFHSQISNNEIISKNSELLDVLRKTLGLNITDLNSEQSVFFKELNNTILQSKNPIITEAEFDYE